MHKRESMEDMFINIYIHLLIETANTGNINQNPL
jgi:hypothetical protein